MEKPNNITKNDWQLLNEIYQNKQPYLQKKLKENYPVQYLIGNVDFCGLKLFVNENVFIPRFETELLIEKTLNIARLILDNPSILDICTGSGCISIALKHFMPKSTVTAVDISAKSLEVAQKNSIFHNQEINFIQKDIFKIHKLPCYDIVISNPPYVRNDEEVDLETKYEPQNALFADDNGLKFYKHILNIVDSKTKLIAFEIGDKQGDEIIKIAKKQFLKAKILLEKDYSNRNRFIFIINDA